MNLKQFRKLAEEINIKISNKKLNLEIGIIVECSKILNLFKEKLEIGVKIDKSNLINIFNKICCYIIYLDILNNKVSKINNNFLKIKNETQMIYLIGTIINDITLEWESGGSELTTSDYLYIVESCLKYYDIDFNSILKIENKENIDKGYNK